MRIIRTTKDCEGGDEAKTTDRTVTSPKLLIMLKGDAVRAEPMWLAVVFSAS